MKAYLVTIGEYSDYQVLAVFTDREAAETFHDAYDKHQSEWGKANQLEEFELFDACPPIAYEHHAVWTQRTDGPTQDDLYQGSEMRWGSEAESLPRVELATGRYPSGQIWLRARGADKEAVVKSVSDQRAKLIAALEMS